MITLEQAREAMEKGQYVLWVRPYPINGCSTTWEKIASIAIFSTEIIVHIRKDLAVSLKDLYLQLDAGALHEALCEVRDSLIQREGESDGKDKA